MSKAICQQALDRVMAYLRGYGIVPDNHICRTALDVVDAALAEGNEGVMERALDKIPEFFDLPEPYLHAERPPLKRGSIGYRPYV